MGLKINVLLELLIVQLGVLVQLLLEQFNKYIDWATWIWLVLVWEKCDIFKGVVSYNEKLVIFPREHNQ